MLMVFKAFAWLRLLRSWAGHDFPQSSPWSLPSHGHGQSLLPQSCYRLPPTPQQIHQNPEIEVIQDEMTKIFSEDKKHGKGPFWKSPNHQPKTPSANCFKKANKIFSKLFIESFWKVKTVFTWMDRRLVVHLQGVFNFSSSILSILYPSLYAWYCWVWLGVWSIWLSSLFSMILVCCLFNSKEMAGSVL